MISATDTIKLLTRVTRVSEKLNNYRLFSTHRKSSLRAQYNEKDAEAKRRDLLARGLPKQKPIKGVKQILVVASGKGGVGKSTIAVNLSVALKILQPDKSVGLLDADVFGPSIPLMMNIHQSPTLNNNDLMEPLLNYGVKCMSMGFLIDEKSTVIWRGLMVMSAIQKLLYQVAWGPLDYLIIDTPPGTGDTHLSLLQNLPVTAALLVTTPQKAALEVTGRGASMFKKLNVPISGIVENMSTIVCPKCSNEMLPFGEGATVLAKELGVDILEKIPLSETIADCSDKGKPIVLSATESMQAMAFKNLAKSVTIFLDKLPMSGE